MEYKKKGITMKKIRFTFTNIYGKKYYIFVKEENIISIGDYLNVNITLNQAKKICDLQFNPENNRICYLFRNIYFVLNNEIVYQYIDRYDRWEDYFSL